MIFNNSNKNFFSESLVHQIHDLNVHHYYRIFMWMSFLKSLLPKIEVNYSAFELQEIFSKIDTCCLSYWPLWAVLSNFSHREDFCTIVWLFYKPWSKHLILFEFLSSYNLLNSKWPFEIYIYYLLVIICRVKTVHEGVQTI